MSAVETSAILEKYAGDRSALIRALQEVQEAYNYLPRESIEATAEHLQVPVSEVLRVATFFKAFSLEPRGKHVVQVCQGTACHVRGGARILRRLEKELDIEAGGTTKDMMFSLEVVRCIGCCSMAPAMRINDDTYGRLTQGRLPAILRKYREEAAQ